MLFSPANNNKMLMTAHLKHPDCIIFDLKDSVYYSEKENARRMLCEAIKKTNYGDCEIFARINALNTPFGEKDVQDLVKSGIKNISIPMCESKEDINVLEEMLTYYENEYGRESGEIKIQGAIETPKGVLNALEIATANRRVVSISFGGEDYTNCLGINRLKTSMEFLYARSHIVLCANVAGIDAIDMVYSDIRDISGFKREAEEAKNLGFSGKSCIHPSQVIKVHEIFSPTLEETENALKIVNAAYDAEKRGIGVITVDGRMIDKPIIEKAERIVRLSKGSILI
ncbi:MAG TPA: citrate lyase subunit beta [Clostridiales bacterium]|nr:citrate lyase subunit beta [Clostridiales bacterium]